MASANGFRVGTEGPTGAKHTHVAKRARRCSTSVGNSSDGGGSSSCVGQSFEVGSLVVVECEAGSSDRGKGRWINVTPTDVPDIDEFTIGDSAPEPSYDIFVTFYLLILFIDSELTISYFTTAKLIAFRNLFVHCNIICTQHLDPNTSILVRIACSRSYNKVSMLSLEFRWR